MKCSTEIVRVVWDDEEGVALQVGPDSDSLGLVELRPKDEKAEEYWGKLRLTLHPKMAAALGQALINAAADADKGGQ